MFCYTHSGLEKQRRAKVRVAITSYNNKKMLTTELGIERMEKEVVY